MAWCSDPCRREISSWTSRRISAARERIEAEGKAWGRPRRLTEVDCSKIAALKTADFFGNVPGALALLNQLGRDEPPRSGDELE